MFFIANEFKLCEIENYGWFYKLHSEVDSWSNFHFKWKKSHKILKLNFFSMRNRKSFLQNIINRKSTEQKVFSLAPFMKLCRLSLNEKTSRQIIFVEAISLEWIEALRPWLEHRRHCSVVNRFTQQWFTETARLEMPQLFYWWEKPKNFCGCSTLNTNV